MTERRLRVLDPGVLATVQDLGRPGLAHLGVPRSGAADPAALRLANRLAAKGGFLVVDEAFVDPHPEMSIAEHAGRDGLVVLKSFGKFFGLAGLRLGFAITSCQFAQRLAECFTKQQCRCIKPDAATIIAARHFTNFARDEPSTQRPARIGSRERYAITQRIATPKALEGFALDGYCFDPAVSEPDRLVFRRRQAD